MTEREIAEQEEIHTAEEAFVYTRDGLYEYGITVCAYCNEHTEYMLVEYPCETLVEAWNQ